MTIFYKNFLKLCASKKISPSSAANQIGLSRAAASGWKNGAVPSDTTIFQLASLFNVPASFFKDGEDLKKAEKTVTVDSDDLDDLDIQFALTIKQLSAQEKRMFLAQMQAWVASRGQ